MQKLLIIALIAAVAGGIYAETLTEIEPYIIGGEDTDITKHSYLVSIRIKETDDGHYEHKCGGSIYAERVVITGAQCVERVPQNGRVIIVAGGNTFNGTEGLLIPVKKSISHPSYSYWTVDYDVGIMILDIPITFGMFTVQPIEIFENRPEVGRLGTVAGWGYLEEYGPNSYQLKETQVPIVSTENCESAYGVGEITERMICAGYIIAGGKDGCHGDTGGPLVIDRKLVGMVSWGLGCARPNFPSVYTYVPALKQWIDDTIAANID